MHLHPQPRGYRIDTETRGLNQLNSILQEHLDYPPFDIHSLQFYVFPESCCTILSRRDIQSFHRFRNFCTAASVGWPAAATWNSQCTDPSRRSNMYSRGSLDWKPRTLSVKCSWLPHLVFPQSFDRRCMRWWAIEEKRSSQ
jgi:hypothetical protein